MSGKRVKPRLPGLLPLKSGRFAAHESSCENNHAKNGSTRLPDGRANGRPPLLSCEHGPRRLREAAGGRDRAHADVLATRPAGHQDRHRRPCSRTRAIRHFTTVTIAADAGTPNVDRRRFRPTARRVATRTGTTCSIRVSAGRTAADTQRPTRTSRTSSTSKPSLRRRRHGGRPRGVRHGHHPDASTRRHRRGESRERPRPGQGAGHVEVRRARRHDRDPGRLPGGHDTRRDQPRHPASVAAGRTRASSTTASSRSSRRRRATPS